MNDVTDESLCYSVQTSTACSVYSACISSIVM